MADEDSSPGGFRRERNLSNRNFHKHGSNRRRFSTESHSSAESKSLNNSPTKDDSTTEKIDSDPTPLTFDFTESSDFNTPSLSSDRVPLIDTTADDTLHRRSEMKTVCLEFEDLSLMHAGSEGQSTLHEQSELKTEFNDVIDEEANRHSAGISQGAYKKQLQKQTTTSSPQTSSSPHTPDPALLDVKQKLLMFENLKQEQPSTFKYKSKSTQSLLESERASSSSPLLSSGIGSVLLLAYPTISSDSRTPLGLKKKSVEEHSEDEVDSLQDEVNEDYVPQERDQFGETSSAVDAEVKEEDVKVVATNPFLTPLFQHSESQEAKAVSPDKLKSPLEETLGRDTTTEATQKPRNKDFPRNFRSRPKTEVLEATSEPLLYEASKYHSVHSKQNSAVPDEDEQIELRDKGFSFVQPILEELIKTEETYVKNLWIGINNYGKIFERKDLRPGLRGKKYVLFGNIEQIAEFHRDEFLPMLQRNKHDLKRIFDEFQRYIDNNYFYGYVLFTMNKQRSLELCETYKNYFKLLQSEIDDKLGINSFLVQPIQRMARYPLLLQQFINTLFKKHREYEMKPTIESCCRLEKKLRNLLITTNESEIINDIVGTGDANEFNTFYQGKFRKVSEFHCFDHTLKRGYRSKVFIFDKCIIYTEIKGKQLILHGRFPCEHIGIMSKQKQFTLFYQHRKQQECDFSADPPLIEQWLELITDMIKSYAEEERRKLKELHSHEFGGDHMHRKPANLSLFRDSNRFSTDSGIGNIWVVPKPEQDEAVSNRTTCVPDEDEQIELRDKGFSFVQPILEELIKTEETYVKNLWIGINNYGKIFERKDLRPGLRGKKYVLFGNIEQIAEFHRDEFLPMLQRNKHDLKRIFDEFQRYIDNNYFYGYVLFTMNKQRSLELCETYKNYFKLLQSEIDDKLGINSFLVQPIQRMARYPLLLQQFINTLFKKHREYEMKPTIESCYRLEKKLRNLLITTNESEIINDIVGTGDANEFNTFYQGKFRKVSEFHCFDHTLKRGYRSKVFIFDKCIIYTEIKGKQLILHGRFPCEHIGIMSKQKQFTLFYQHRKQQECDFSADPPLIEQWLELITDMIKSYAEEERRKLKELHSHEFGGDHMHRKPANLSLFRDSNRFSTDSGIGNIWVVPKPEQDEAVSNRTTWYALT